MEVGCASPDRHNNKQTAHSMSATNNMHKEEADTTSISARASVASASYACVPPSMAGSAPHMKLGMSNEPYVNASARGNDDVARVANNARAEKKRMMRERESRSWIGE